MPINVVCPGCRKRFAVSDKFAGKKGPCPKCKTVIQVPDKEDEVVVHAPEDAGPKGSTGQAVLKPIARTETKISPLLTAVILVSIVVALGIAWMFRSPEGDAPTLLLLLGAIALGPPLAWAGYSFLRDDELEPFENQELWIRVFACGAVYAVLWGLVAVVKYYVFDGADLEVVHMVFLVPVLVGIGAFAGFASLDLDYSMAAVHYSLYLAVTVVLRLIMNLDAL